MLRWRLLLGAVFIAALALLFWFDLRSPTPGVFLLPMAVVLSLAAAGEMLRLTGVREQRPLAPVVYGGSALVVAVTGIPFLAPDYPADCPLGTLGWPLAAFVAAAIVAMVGEMLRYESPEGVARDAALTLFGVCYAGLLMSFLVQLRFIDVAAGGGTSGVPLISMIFVVKLCDIGAYTVGRLVGRHKLAPRLSPGKTVEGLFGGLLFSCLGSVLFFDYLAPGIDGGDGVSVPVWAAAVYGLVLGTAGVIGDLAESLLKRDSGYKDSSAWLPGFGGVLDLLDSPLLAAPIACALWVSGIMAL